MPPCRKTHPPADAALNVGEPISGEMAACSINHDENGHLKEADAAAQTCCRCRNGAGIRSFLLSANDLDTGVPRNMSTLPLVSTEGISGIRVVLVCRIVKEHRRLAAGPAVLLGDKAVHLVSELNCESIVPKARDRTVDLALIKGVDDSSEFHGPIMPYVLVTQGNAIPDLGRRRDRRH